MGEVATQLNVSRATVYRLIKAGELQALYIGNSIRIRPVDLEAYITGARATNTDAGGAAT